MTLLSIFSDCCDSLEVYHNGPLEYTHSSIYGYYVKQDDFGNRPWYRNGGRSIWWDEESWVLGQTTDIQCQPMQTVIFEMVIMPPKLHSIIKSS